jgi:hypothetical protein
MTLDDALGWTSLALILMMMAVSLWALASFPRGPRVRCPGRCRGVLAWIDPRKALIRGSCWYDLTGLKVDAGGRLRCPECGGQTSMKKLCADGRRVRLELIAAALLVCAIGTFSGPWIQGGCWTRSIPTLALAMVERSGNAGEGTDLGDEIEKRVWGGAMTGLAGSVLAEALVRDLRDDDARWNAHRALRLLEKLGVEADGPLLRTLYGGDDQARVLAARILRSRQFPPSRELLWACVEDLRDDADTVDWYLCGRNARGAADYLVNWAPEAREFLRVAMCGGDRQQRLLAAAVVGHAADTDMIDFAAPILIEHLRDNDVDGDAKVAAPALYRFGVEVLPYLRAHADSDDAQARAIVRSIIERLEHPERSIHRLRNPMPRITVSTSDPLGDMVIGSSTSDLRWPR